MEASANTNHARKVRRLLPAVEIDMNGTPVLQPIPALGTNRIDPFLLLHHHSGMVEGGGRPFDSGVGPHPHRGFSPVTFIYQGDVHHRDSRGNSAVVGAGGVQWMNAGMGIIHSERPSARLAEQGGPQEIIQLWINTPARHKLDQPAYYSIDKQNIPLVPQPDPRVELRLIAGSYGGKTGFRESLSPVLILDAKLEKSGELSVEIPGSMNLILYNLDNPVEDATFGIIDGKTLAWYHNEGSSVKLTAKEHTRLLILAGEPLNEPVETYGPFVMTNQTEIMQAIKDYQMGKMGILIEETDH